MEEGLLKTGYGEIWITWNNSQRSRNIAKDLGLPIFEKVFERNPLSRHILSSLWTIYLLTKLKPRKVYLQYSFLLLVIVAIYKRLSFNPVCIICDCHTKALRRGLDGTLSTLFWWIKSKSFQAVALPIITNTEMLPDILRLSDRFFILPDKIPEIKIDQEPQQHETYCVFVCSYAIDEPLREVIEAAQLLEGTIKVYCTGRIPAEQANLVDQPYKNIHFTGFLNTIAYNKLISHADCILALTSEEGCLQCAGYEALSVGTPLVVSDTTALKAYFHDSAIYVKHQAQDISNGVRLALRNSSSMQLNTQQLKSLRTQEYRLAMQKLISTVSQLS
jgi:glycosyltransferase involved in cell wall biosynthesis